MNPNARIVDLALPVPKEIRPAPPGGLPARCTVGLLTWNGGQDAAACVESMMAQSEAPLELVWVDNASTDGTPERLRARFAGLPAPLVNPGNLGFCVGHNQALAACRTRYYLALNQDVVLAPDYIEKLCDWMDGRPELALSSGLILMPGPGGEPALDPAAAGARVYSAGLVFPRARFAFELGMGAPPRPRWLERRLTPGVDGAAMMLRLDACRRVSQPADEIFPSEFFAYAEEVDLALRLARAGLACGVEGAAVASHRARGSGGFRRAAIRAKFFCNHWLLTLRHDPWPVIVRELPYLLRGEARYWLPEYARHPWALALALGDLFTQCRRARRFYHAFERAFGPTRPRLDALRALAQRELRAQEETHGNHGTHGNHETHGTP